MQKITKLSCLGYRGFQTKQSIKLALPNEKFGSGLTILIGPNGGGKSTIIESFRLLSSIEGVSFTEGKRNKVAGDKVELKVFFNSKKGSLKTVATGGSETTWESDDGSDVPKISFLPSRRVFNPYFGGGTTTRERYYKNTSKFTSRAAPLNDFSQRLFNARDNYDKFSKVFERIYGKKLDWTIELNDNDNHYIKIKKAENVYHSSDGMGEGLVSLLFLVDAIYELTKDEILVIDEPELSLHPQLQRRLMLAIGELASDRQILYATHSPEMVSIDAIINGMEVVRVVDEEDGSKIYQLGDDQREVFRKLENDLFNPHAFSYESIACLFAEDNLVITEGQEDVVFFNKMVKDLNLDYNIPFWGFGAGGATKIKLIASVLQSLGFKNISAIFDGDRLGDYDEFKETFPDYKVFKLPADDIRDKEDKGVVTKQGIYGLDKKIKIEHIGDCKDFLASINQAVNAHRNQNMHNSS